MGKKVFKGGRKKPLNHSLSLSLPYLKSTVELEIKPKSGSKVSQLDLWEPLGKNKKYSFELSHFEKKRFLNHLRFLKKSLNFKKSFIVRSKNNFPLGVGLASSASSFASLTYVVWKTISDLKALEENSRDLYWDQKREFKRLKARTLKASRGLKEGSKKIFSLKGLSLLELKNLSEFSEKASGSSARSFFSPWCFWDKKNGARHCKGLPFLYHMVVLVEKEKKMISSSLAHELVLCSALFKNRPERAEVRLKSLLKALRTHEWKAAFSIVWSEFWDMHSLFETSLEPFGYLTEGSFRVLHFIRNLWEQKKDGPLVTMDAGPSVHLLFRKDQKRLGQEVFLDLRKRFSILCDPFFNL